MPTQGGGKAVPGCEPLCDAGEKCVPAGIAGPGGLRLDESPVVGRRFVQVLLEELEQQQPATIRIGLVGQVGG
ncbi:MAG: hypothetical protein ACYDH5_02995 [Acidimicrobiales bacterium]